MTKTRSFWFRVHHKQPSIKQFQLLNKQDFQPTDLPAGRQGVAKKKIETQSYS